MTRVKSLLRKSREESTAALKRRKDRPGATTNEADPTPQAPISEVEPEQNQSRGTAGAVKPVSPLDISMLAGIGAAAAGG
jgi:hypothetical protein